MHGVALNLSECCVPFLPSVDIERGFRRKFGAGDAGGGFFRVKSLGMSGWNLYVREIFFLIHCMNIIILVYYDG